MKPFSTQAFPFRTLVHTSLITIGIALLLLYVLWQARFLLLGPQIALTAEPSLVNNERIITLTGTASNISKITLNGRQIFTDPSGNFSEALVLENGYTIATIAATDRYGRTTKLERPFMYTPASLVSS